MSINLIVIIFERIDIRTHVLISNTTMPLTHKEVYEEKTLHQHVLDKTEMYVGNVFVEESEDFVLVRTVDENKPKFQIERRLASTSQALTRIFVEVVSNAIDNVERSKNANVPCTEIRVTINPETGETSVWNDGYVIPIEKHSPSGVYNHSLLFGRMLTSSNYNKDTRQRVSGTYGIGVTACNILSTSFEVMGYDPENKKRLTQLWTRNMWDTDGPIVKESKAVKPQKGFTKVTWTPDFARFGLTGYTDDIIGVYMRFLLDAAMLTKVKVTYNGERLPASSLSDYSKFFDAPSDERIVLSTNPDMEVVVTTASGDPSSVSFVNGVLTRDGGKHVDAWSKAVLDPIMAKLNKKDGPKISVAEAKQHFRFFVNARIDEPVFAGQDKHKLLRPKVDAKVDTKHITAISKWSVVDELKDLVTLKDKAAMKKSEKKKKTIQVDGLTDANKAGSKESSDCTLILCEGESAASYAIAGARYGLNGKQGLDYIGVLPLRGKLLNCHGKTLTAAVKNKVVCNIADTLGLEGNRDYTKVEDRARLRYGHVTLLCDADDDGLHIEGLILNFLQSACSSLLERQNRYVAAMRTPITRISQPKQKDIMFYDHRTYHKYVKTLSEKERKKITVSFYKGLGSQETENIQETFGTKLVEYYATEECESVIDQFFGKSSSDARKLALSNYSPDNTPSMDDTDAVSETTICHFLQYNMIQFVLAACERAIPSVMDGLKPSQRKIVFGVFEKPLLHSSNKMRVSQVAGFVGSVAAYHHGDTSLEDTIKRMVNYYPGSNNIPLLDRIGQFGTRLEGGKDCAASRYVFTRASELFEYVFSKKDNDSHILNYLIEDGDSIEPEYYAPVIPLILANGCVGVGSGWSTDIPSYNPLELVEAVRTWLENDGEILIQDDDMTHSLLPELLPWFAGFKGTVAKHGSGYMTTGVVTKMEKKDTFYVSELPIGTWTNPYRDNCVNWLNSKMIKDVRYDFDTTRVGFEIVQNPDGFACTVKNLKLTSTIKGSNMVAWDTTGKLRKYNSVDEIIVEFCRERYRLYTKRKELIVSTLERELRSLGNKERFISEVVDNKLKLLRQEEEKLVQELSNRGYDREQSNDDSHGYDYLLRIQAKSFTANKIKELQNDIASKQQKLDNVISTTEKEMWMEELSAFEKAYTGWLKAVENEINRGDTAVTKSGKTRKGRVVKK